MILYACTPGLNPENAVYAWTNGLPCADVKLNQI